MSQERPEQEQDKHQRTEPDQPPVDGPGTAGEQEDNDLSDSSYDRPG
jgi:hypothetical protein